MTPWNAARSHSAPRWPIIGRLAVGSPTTRRRPAGRAAGDHRRGGGRRRSRSPRPPSAPGPGRRGGPADRQADGRPTAAPAATPAFMSLEPRPVQPVAVDLGGEGFPGPGRGAQRHGVEMAGEAQRRALARPGWRPTLVRPSPIGCVAGDLKPAASSSPAASSAQGCSPPGGLIERWRTRLARQLDGGGVLQVVRTSSAGGATSTTSVIAGLDPAIRFPEQVLGGLWMLGSSPRHDSGRKQARPAYLPQPRPDPVIGPCRLLRAGGAKVIFEVLRRVELRATSPARPTAACWPRPPRSGSRRTPDCRAMFSGRHQEVQEGLGVVEVRRALGHRDIVHPADHAFLQDRRSSPSTSAGASPRPCPDHCWCIAVSPDTWRSTVPSEL